MRAALIAVILLTSTATPVFAQQQNTTVTLRVDKLEKEMKAVQRKVFPNGVALEPEIGGSTVPGALPGTPASSPVADLTARVDALESQLGSITSQVEQAGFRLKKLEEANKAIEKQLKALEAANAEKPADTASPALQIAPTPAPKPVALTPTPKPPAPKPAATTAKPATTALAKPEAPTTSPKKPIVNDPKRAAAIKAAVEIPVTNDPLDDAYSYGYRLWAAKFYPEAEAQLKDFVAKNPKHKKASAAQMFLGRAYLDEGKPGLASVAFFENYQKNPKGERAAESLYWLGTALTKLKKLPDACKVYQEFDDVYGVTAAASLKAKVASGRADAQCAK